MFNKNSEVIDHINTLKGYRGYVQFSHRPLEQKDIFENKDPDVQDEAGFIYEAHFANTKESIMIRQQNEQWIISTTDISDIDEKDTEFYAIEKTEYLKSVKSNWVKMVQIWQSEPDELCENMKVMKLKKVVFAGFTEEKGDKS